MRIGSISIFGAIATLSIALAASDARAIEVRMDGKLELPPHTAVMPITTDPVMQRVLSEAVSAARPRWGDVSSTLTLTVSIKVNQLAPGVSLNQLIGGDPAMIALLKQAGAEPPPLGDTGDAPIDPYAQMGERGRALTADDAATTSFRNFQGMQKAFGGKSSSPYDSIPKDRIYDTVIVARATLSGTPDVLRLVAVLHADEDARRARELVAEDIANSLLH